MQDSENLNNIVLKPVDCKVGKAREYQLPGVAFAAGATPARKFRQVADARINRNSSAARYRCIVPGLEIVTDVRKISDGRLSPPDLDQPE
jgi:hypothetical protein